MAGILLFGFGVQWYLIAIIAAVCVALLYFPDRFYTFGVLAIAAGWFCASVHASASLPASMHGSNVKLSAKVLRIVPSGDYSRLLVAADPSEAWGSTALCGFGFHSCAMPMRPA